MLKSTGYFRGIECPFGDCCRRPYCHFRHRGRGIWGSTPVEARTEAEYDPSTPDLLKSPICLDDGVLEVAPEPGLDILELERVNKAIEAVKNEMEREQRKYERLLETQKDYNVATSKSKPSSSVNPLEYDPGCHASSDTYNPTPLAHSQKGGKYTLDDGDRVVPKTRCLEYVPTVRARAPKETTNKYVIDNSKPHTDMEYDPMSNYSARLLNKDKRQRTKRDRRDSLDEGYSPSPKKMCNSVFEVSVDATFTESDEDTGPVVLQSNRSSSSKKTGKASAKSSKYVEKNSKDVKEMAVQYNMDDIEKPEKNHRKCSKDSKQKSKNEKRSEPKGQSKVMKSKTSDLTKEPKKEKSKITEKSKSEHVKNGEIRDGHKPKTKSNKLEKQKDQVKGSSSLSKKETTGNKCAKEKNPKKTVSNKSGDAKNGKIKEKSNLERPSKSKVATPSSVKVKSKQRTLSHVDLFGDESSEEDVAKLTLGSHGSSLGSDGGGHSDTEGEINTKIDKLNCRRVSTSSADSVDVDYSALENDLDSDSDPMEECLRVFNESQDVKTEDKGRMGKQSQEDSNEQSVQTLTTLFPGQKRRISHVAGPNSVSTSKPVIPQYHRPTPQEICYRRIQRAQEQATQLLAQKKALQLNSAKATASPIPHSKKRIAHLPGSRSSASSTLCQLVSPEAKTGACSGVDEASNDCTQSLKLRTLSGMTSKTRTTAIQKRQAHVPSLQSASLKRPVIPTEFGAKVPTTVRQRYLNIFIDECLKFCTEQEAFDKALEEEKIVYNRSSSRNIYLNVAVNALKKLRSQGPGTKAVTSKPTNKVISHESVLGGKLAAKTSFSIQRKIGHHEEELTDMVFYTKLKDYVLTTEQLQQNGYPAAHPDKPGRAMISMTEQKTDSSCRVCCRCGARYLVTPSGNCVRQEECCHHWGRLRRIKVSGVWENQYNCCSGAVGSTGCQVCKQHVHDNRKENLDGFVKTFEKLLPADGNPGVYALDCEMCYTTQGLELTRVTVINCHLKVVYDTFVKPDNKIVDYNTRFSGVTEADMQNTTISLRDVQAVILSMFSTDTILIGHSLESDFFALKVIHPTVVDTAVVFPHRIGFPYKRALRSLMADHLHRIIQDGVAGHDSSEDARSCMELMKWKIKEDAKVKR